jgi:hypothetical protein
VELKTLALTTVKGIYVIVSKRQVLQMWENYITELYERRNRPENLEVEPAEKVDADEKGSQYYLGIYVGYALVT